MKAKLQSYFDTRIPLVLRKRNDIIYFQMQVDIAREDGLSDDYYLEFYKLVSENNHKKTGEYTLNLLKRYHEIGDIAVSEFQEITGQSLHEYRQTEGQHYLEFMDAKNSEDVSLNYDKCIINYDLNNNMIRASKG